MGKHGRPPLSIERALDFFRLCEEAYANGASKPGDPKQGNHVRAALSIAAAAHGYPSGGHHSYYSACVRLLGREPNWVRADAPPKTAGPEIPLSERERIRYTDEIARLRAELRTAYRHDLSAERIREEVFGLVARSPDPPEWLAKPSGPAGAPGVPSTIWSDWHFNEVVRPEEVAHANAYNNEIARARIHRLVERTIDLCFKHMLLPPGDAPYPGIVVNLGGDMISGDIHDELRESNAAPTMPTVVELQDLLAAALTLLADRFGRVFVPCVVGNHGRSTHKPRAKGRVHTSYEWLMYQNLERHFRFDDRVQFYIPGETDAHYRVFGHRYMLSHGDSLGVKGGDGIIGAIGPIMRGTIKTARSEAFIGRDFDTLLLGHWHQLLWLPGCYVNGSLKGWDEYARLYLRARAETPQQALWWTHPVRGPTFHTAVQVEDRQQSPSPWLEVWRATA